MHPQRKGSGREGWVLIGDFNAQIIGGKSKHLVSNENGIKVIEFAMANNTTKMLPVSITRTFIK